MRHLTRFSRNGSALPSGPEAWISVASPQPERGPRPARPHPYLRHDVSGSPPASEMISGRAVTAIRSRIADDFIACVRRANSPA